MRCVVLPHVASAFSTDSLSRGASFVSPNNPSSSRGLPTSRARPFSLARSICGPLAAFLATYSELTTLPRQEQRDGAIKDRVEAMKRGKVNSQGSDFHLVQEIVPKAKDNSVACGYLTQPPTK